MHTYICKNVCMHEDKWMDGWLIQKSICVEVQISKKKHSCASGHQIARYPSIFIKSLQAGYPSCPASTDRSEPRFFGKEGVWHAASMWVCPWDKEKQIFVCWVAMNKYLPVFIPHPRVGLALRLIKWAFFVFVLALSRVFPPWPSPAFRRGLVWEVGACWTKLLHNYQGCRGGMGTGWLGRINERCGERGGISLNTEWVKLTSGEGRRQPEAEKRRWRGTICALSHIHCCLLKLEGCEQKQNLI